MMLRVLCNSAPLNQPTRRGTNMRIVSCSIPPKVIEGALSPVPDSRVVDADGLLSRRGLFALIASAPLATLLVTPRRALADGPTKNYKGSSYSVDIPSTWTKKDKAGADALFEDPAQKSTSVGVTVNQVRIDSIENFGNLDFVGQKLVEAEKAKESTLGVTVVSQQSRQEGGVTYYDFEYILDSTRGKKRIYNTVTINKARLVILNGNVKCDKEDTSCEGGEATAAVRAAARSLRVK